MDFETISPYLPYIIEVGKGILLCIFILILAWVMSRWAERFVVRTLGKKVDDKAVMHFVGGLVRYAVLAAGVIGALQAVGVETTSLVAILGTAGLAVGLALQGNLSHFASGVMILFFRPFSIDDVVTVAGHTGKVVEIGIFATVLHTPTNEKVIIPNGAIAGGSIVNITVLPRRRGTVSVGVAYGTDIKRAKEVLLAAANSVEFVLEDPAPAIANVGLGASSVDFGVHVWSENENYLAMLDGVRTACYDHLNEAGIEIPFNQIVVHQAPAEE